MFNEAALFIVQAMEREEERRLRAQSQVLVNAANSQGDFTKVYKLSSSAEISGITLR